MKEKYQFSSIISKELDNILKTQKKNIPSENESNIPVEPQQELNIQPTPINPKKQFNQNNPFQNALLSDLKGKLNSQKK